MAGQANVQHQPLNQHTSGVTSTLIATGGLFHSPLSSYLADPESWLQRQAWVEICDACGMRALKGAAKGRYSLNRCLQWQGNLCCKLRTCEE